MKQQISPGVMAAIIVVVVVVIGFVGYKMFLGPKKAAPPSADAQKMQDNMRRMNEEAHSGKMPAGMVMPHSGPGR